MIIAEDLLLLLTDDDTGRATVDAGRLELALAGAVLVELAAAGRVGIGPKGGLLGGSVVTVLDGAPLGDPVLDEGLARVAARRPTSPQNLLRPLAKQLPGALRDRLVARGVLRAEHGTVLGVFPTRSWPAEDSTHEEAVRTGLREVLVQGRTPTDREASLVALLHAVDVVPRQFAQAGVTRKELRRRATAVAQDHPAGDAVRRAVAEVNAAMVVVLGAAVVAGASG